MKNQISLIASIMKSKNRNGTKKKTKSKMTVPTLSTEIKERFKSAFLAILKKNSGEWLRWVDVDKTVVMNDKEMNEVSKRHNRPSCLGPASYTLVQELIKAGLLETDKVNSQRLIKLVA